MQTQIGSLNAFNGLGLAAGYDQDGSLLESLKELGPGIIEIGTVSAVQTISLETEQSN